MTVYFKRKGEGLRAADLLMPGIVVPEFADPVGDNGVEFQPAGILAHDSRLKL
jgi:hypothetical protein